jgi:hypothetical protein
MNTAVVEHDWLRITGRWKETEEPSWERFTLVLNGEEAGDHLESWQEVRRVLAEAGLRLVRIDTGEEVK